MGGVKPVSFAVWECWGSVERTSRLRAGSLFWLGPQDEQLIIGTISS